MSEDVTKTAYTIEALRDAVEVLQYLMSDLSPRIYFTISDLAKAFPAHSQNKIFRIVRTFEECGWVEKHPTAKSYKVGHDLLYLSHKYFNRLNDELLFIKQEVQSFHIK